MSEHERDNSNLDETRITPGVRGEGSDSDAPTRASGSAFRRPTAAELNELPLIDGYEIHEKLHHGGQGIVFRATQLGTKRQAALKVLLEGQYASENARQRFEREVELAASLTHPNIVTILDSGVSHGRCYYAMDYIDGPRLNDYFKEKQPELRNSLELMEKICAAVNYAHQRGVIHRDLKPSNILIDSEGEPHVLDFGLAKAQRGADPHATTMPALSMTGQVLGTLAYMSPEQASGSADVDVRSDVYSLGVIAYELLLGRPPYPVDGPLGDVLSRIVNSDPKPPRAVRSSSRFGRLIDDELETILLKALEKDVSRRYQSSGDYGRDIQRYLAGEPIEAKRASGMYMLKKTIKRYRLQAASAAAVLLMLVTFLAVFYFQYRQERTLRAQAEELRATATEKAENAAAAEAREREARQQAVQEKQSAILAAERLREALVRQTIQRGDLAMLRGDPAEARDSYWDAYLDAPDSAAALWALRQYYMQTDAAGASFLHEYDYGPAALARGGRLAAACDAPNSVTLREVKSDRTLAWLATPGEVLAMNATEDGQIAAVGADWARLWEAPSLTPSIAVEFPRKITPLAAYPIMYNRGLLVLDDTYAWSFDTDGNQIDERSFSGNPLGKPALSPSGKLAALLTTGGIELVTIGDEGELSLRRIWTSVGSEAARAVRFLDTDTLAVLADQLYIIQLGDGKSMRWRLPVELQDGWRFFDVQNGGRTLVFGKVDGEAALYQDGELLREWSVTRGALRDMRLTENGETLVTLDDEGAVTSWETNSTTNRPRRVSTTPAAKWASSRDGSAVIFADETGAVTVYETDRGLRKLTLEWGGLFRMIAGGSADDVMFALNGDGSRAIVTAENRMWVVEVSSLEATPLPWRNVEGLTLTHVSLSDDGKYAAFCGSNPMDERQLVFIKPLNEARSESFEEMGRQSQRGFKAVEFVGSAVNEIAFLPGSSELLVARTNGELLRLDVKAMEQQPREQTAPLQPPAPWIVLDSAARQISVNRTGEFLAAACEDWFVRLIDMRNEEVLSQINVGPAHTSIELNAAGDTLLTMTTDGLLSLYAPETGECITKTAPAIRSRYALAKWIGDGETVLLSDDAIYELRPDRLDEIIEQNRVYASQRRIANALEDQDYETAWRSAEALCENSPEIGRNMRTAVLRELLQHPRRKAPEAWLTAVEEHADLLSCMLLGHAAYEGSRFDLAFRFLTEADRLSGGEIDAYTAWRLAECHYLLERRDTACAGLHEVINRNDFSSRDIPRAYLELLTALTLADRQAEIVEVHKALARSDRLHQLSTNADITAMQLLGRALLETGARQPTRRQLQTLFGFLEGLGAPYRDDIEFLTGELAMKRGEFEQAELRYQHCVDLAQDDWPANWARYRLMQLPHKDS